MNVSEDTDLIQLTVEDVQLSEQELTDYYDFELADAKQIEQQFPQTQRGLMSWQDLAYAIQELDEHQKRSSIILVNKFTGEVFAAIDNCLTMHIENATLQQEVNKNMMHLASDEQPLLIF